MLEIVLLTTLLAVTFYYYYIRPLSYWRKRGVKQGNPKWYFGDTWSTLIGSQTRAEFDESTYKKFSGSRYYGIYQFTKPSLVIRDPELIKQIGIKHFDHFLDHSAYIDDDVDPLWSKNLLQLRGQKWRDMRTILSPSFTSSKMKLISSLMVESAEDFVKHFLGKQEDFIETEMKDTLSRYANDIIATTAFGVKVDSLLMPNNEFYRTGQALTNPSLLKSLELMILPNWLLKLLKIKLADDKLANFFSSLIKQTISIREEKKIVRPDMVQLLMQERRPRNEFDVSLEKTEKEVACETTGELLSGKVKKYLEDDDIAAQMMIFLFGGFDTISSILSFLFYEISINQDIQIKMREEIEKVLEESQGKITYEALTKMKYMDMVVTETLRKWPTFIRSDRICTKPFTIEPVNSEEKPVVIEKGTEIIIPIYAIQRDPKYYRNPERFDPERFSVENADKLTPTTYLPFGLGPRICIGSRFALLESKILACHIISNFEIVPVKRTKIDLQFPPKPFSMKFCGGIWLGLKRIQK